MSRTSKQQTKVVKISEIEEVRQREIELSVKLGSAKEKLNELIDLIDVICTHYDHYAANYTFETLLDALQSHSLDIRNWMDETQPPKGTYRKRPL